jgi:HK97 gp10 family phage protein
MARSFASLLDLARHFDTVAARLPAAEHVMLGEIGVNVEAKAKSKLGTYQAGWEKLAASTLAFKAAHGFPVPSPLLRTTEMQRSIGHHVHARSVTIGAGPRYAFFQEVGTSKMPPRPFIGPSMKESMSENMAILGKGIAQVFRSS